MVITKLQHKKKNKKKRRDNRLRRRRRWDNLHFLPMLLLFIGFVWLFVQTTLWTFLVQDEKEENQSRRQRQHHDGAVSIPIIINNNNNNNKNKINNKVIRRSNNHTTNHKMYDVDNNNNNNNNNANTKNTDESFIHIVFSTDCSRYQHWQGILLYYSSIRINQQPDTTTMITRIASGCTDQQQKEIYDEWKLIDPTQTKFNIHFAPSTALLDNFTQQAGPGVGRRSSSSSTYQYSNKPGGILHWLQHTELQNDTVVCLLDPDMILLKPITTNLILRHWIKRRRNHGNTKLIEYIDPENNNIPQLLRMVDVDNVDDVVDKNNNNNNVTSSSSRQSIIKITTGSPAGQHFGAGGAWVNSGQHNSRPVWSNFSKSYVCGGHHHGGKCTQTTFDDAKYKFAVGPVYIATVHDWMDIATKWWEFVPKVYKQYPYLLAEMYSFTMAVADLDLPFHLFSNYMITGSDVFSPTEAWTWIDEYYINNDNDNDVSNNNDDKNKNNTNNINWIHRSCPTTIGGNSNNNSIDHHNNNNMFPIPNTLHYCQRYKFDIQGKTFLWAKRRIPHDVFSCGSSDIIAKKEIPFDLNELIELLLTSSSNNNVDVDSSSLLTRIERRTIFALCQLVSILNWARRKYHQDVCGITW